MNDRLWIGTRKGLIEWHRSGGGWRIATTHFLGDPVTMMLIDARDNTLYAALNLGHFGVKMRRSTDAGKTWEETAAPLYPEKPADSTDETPWKLHQVWALEAGGASEAGTLWCGTLPGGLFKSTDRGGSWTLVRSLWDRPERAKWFGGGADHPGIHSICVDPRNSKHLTLAVSCGGVWQSKDGGESWSVGGKGMRAAYMPPEQADDPVTQDPHRVVQSLADPEVFWCQHHNDILLSRDGCRLWQAIDNVPVTNFGFAVATHPKHANTAWFVPAEKDQCRVAKDLALCVLRTRDGGKSFDVLRSGLPQQHCYDLIYRHALDVDASGERLAMASTTGGLWLSENGGDSWVTLSTHLPPVNCVRFG